MLLLTSNHHSSYLLSSNILITLFMLSSIAQFAKCLPTNETIFPINFTPPHPTKLFSPPRSSFNVSSTTVFQNSHVLPDVPKESSRNNFLGKSDDENDIKFVFNGTRNYQNESQTVSNTISNQISLRPKVESHSTTNISLLNPQKSFAPPTLPASMLTNDKTSSLKIFFPNHLHNVHLSENSALFTHVITVTAFIIDLAEYNYIDEQDLDAQHGDKVTIKNVKPYEENESLEKKNENNYSGQSIEYSIDHSAFHIHPYTGLVSVFNPFLLDYEQHQVIEVAVMAVYDGLHDIAKVIVHLTDVNDNPPVFDKDVYKTKVREDAKVGTYLLQVSAHDADSGRNAEIRYSIVSGNVGKAFRINALTGTLHLNAPIDRESTHLYNLTILARDRGKNRQKSRTFVELKVLGLNDEIPYLRGGPVFVSLREGTEIGSIITVLEGIDDDVDEKKGLKFEILAEYNLANEEMFDVFLGGGDQSRACDGKYIMYKKHNKQLLAANERLEAKNHQFNNVNTMKSGVIDDNVHRNITCFEEMQKSSLSELHVKLLADGKVVVARSFDYESFKQHLIIVKLSDGKHHHINHLTIKVIDDNDNPPTFDQHSQSVEISELLSPELPVIKLTAVDKDSGENGRISYELIGSDAFKINKSSGAISTKRRIDILETKQDFALLVKATDHGIPSLFSFTTLVVHMIDINNHSPRFLITSYNVSVLENSLNRDEALVMFQVADDDVEEANKIMSFNICSICVLKESGASNSKKLCDLSENHLSKFKVKNGGLWLIGELDREEEELYEIIISVNGDKTSSDQSSYSNTCVNTGSTQKNLSNEAVIYLHVIDMNDNYPQFEYKFSTFHLPEDFPVDQLITVMRAYDADLNAVVKYKIVKGDTRVFHLDAFTGDLTLRSHLDFEKRGHYSLLIEASNNYLSVTSNDKKENFIKNEKNDTCHAENKNQTCINIVVEDVNEYAPVFTSLMYIAYMKPFNSSSVSHDMDESFGPLQNTVETQNTKASPIFRVNAIDMDQGVYGGVTYFIYPSLSRQTNKNGFFDEKFNLNNKRKRTEASRELHQKKLHEKGLSLGVDSSSGDVYVVGGGYEEGRYNFVVVAQDYGLKNTTVAAMVFVTPKTPQSYQELLQKQKFFHNSIINFPHKKLNLSVYEKIMSTPDSMVFPMLSSDQKSGFGVATSHIVLLSCFILLVIICVIITIFSLIIRRKASVKFTKRPLSIPSNHPQPSSIDTLSITIPTFNHSCDEEVNLINQSSINSNSFPDKNNNLCNYYSKYCNNIFSSESSSSTNGIVKYAYNGNSFRVVSAFTVSEDEKNTLEHKDDVFKGKTLFSDNIITTCDVPSNASLLRNKINQLPKSSVWKKQKIVFKDEETIEEDGNKASLPVLGSIEMFCEEGGIEEAFNEDDLDATSHLTSTCKHEDVNDEPSDRVVLGDKKTKQHVEKSTDCNKNNLNNKVKEKKINDETESLTSSDLVRIATWISEEKTYQFNDLSRDFSNHERWKLLSSFDNHLENKIFTI